VVIVDRITPSEIVVVVRRVIDGTIVKVEIGVAIPRAPTISRCMPLNHFNLWLSPISRYLKMFHVKLFATLCDDMKFHPSIFDMTHCRYLNSLRTIFCSQDKSITVACLLSIFVMVTAASRLALGITNPNTSRDGFFVVFNLQAMGFPSIPH
jgi:hypothetical protein